MVRTMKRLPCVLLLGLVQAVFQAQPAWAELPISSTATASSPSATTEEVEPDYLALADTPLFLPRNYLYWGTPVGPSGKRVPLVFGMEYALHLPIFNDVRDQLLKSKDWAFAATLSFEGALRMLATESKPVRMPSYRPSFSSQLFHAWHNPYPVVLGLRASLYHYSNGQERCAFDESVSDQSPTCLDEIETTQKPSTDLNRRSGNFTTSGLLFDLNARVHKLNANGLAVAHLSAGIAYSTLFKTFLGSMDGPTRALYGSGHIDANLEGKRRMGWAALTVRSTLTHFLRDDARVPSTAGAVEAVLAPYWLSGLGLFARYYGGRDPYNAFFVDRIQQFAAGVAWDGERPLKFGQRP